MDYSTQLNFLRDIVDLINQIRGIQNKWELSDAQMQKIINGEVKSEEMLSFLCKEKTNVEQTVSPSYSKQLKSFNRKPAFTKEMIESVLNDCDNEIIFKIPPKGKPAFKIDD